MQAFAVVRLQIGSVVGLVMPGFITTAWFHGRQNAYHARLFSALVQDGLDPILFAETLAAAHELDLQAVFGGDALHVFPQAVAQGLRPLGVVEDWDMLRMEELGHALCIAPSGHRSLDDDPVVTGESSRDAVLIAFGKQFNAHAQMVADCPVWFRLRRVREREVQARWTFSPK